MYRATEEFKATEGYSIEDFSGASLKGKETANPLAGD